MRAIWRTKTLGPIELYRLGNSGSLSWCPNAFGPPAAIRLAIAEAEAGDVVVVAGKGHEDYQIVGTEKRAFSDRETVQACLSGDVA